ncbi:MAG TPA: DUF1800 domain-containing protein [Burkholderiaceae bacterium]|nr:DUF1800 domain-containing protein [Burkholderiaceae bacterium]
MNGSRWPLSRQHVQVGVAAMAVGLLLTAGGALAAVPSINPAVEEPLGPARARLLLTRAGFAPAVDEVAQLAPLSHRAAVDRLLADAGTGATALTPPPKWVNERIIMPRELRAMSDEQRRQEIRKQIGYAIELRGWWLQEMAGTPAPLGERMTLFWHNHFVSAQPKVRATQLMFRQNVLLRRHALGNFGELLHAVAKDPAMLVYLDSATSRKERPNENFAREVMELFTLGEGRYTETDVKEAARAFTGWSIDLRAEQFVFRGAWHDNGEKTVLGKQGRWRGEDVLDILLAHPATAETIVRKLWLEFVSPQPDPERVAAIAARFRADYSVAAAVRLLLLQPEVITRTEENALVKSPVELMVGLTRQSGGALRPRVAALATASMGQNLFSAPNVRGWPGGEAWITTQTLLARKQLVARVLSPPAPPAMTAEVDEGTEEAAGAQANPKEGLRRLLARVPPLFVPAERWLGGMGLHPERTADSEHVSAAAAQLLVLPPHLPPADDTLGLDAVRQLLLDPVYQLK